MTNSRARSPSQSVQSDSLTELSLTLKEPRSKQTTLLKLQLRNPLKRKRWVAATRLIWQAWACSRDLWKILTMSSCQQDLGLMKDLLLIRARFQSPLLK